MALVGMLPYGVVSSWSIFSLRKSGIYYKRKKDWRFVEVGGTSLVGVFQQFLNINGTKPLVNYYRQSYISLRNLKHQLFPPCDSKTFCSCCIVSAMVLCHLNWARSRDWVIVNCWDYLMIAITTFSKAFLDILILSTLENLKDNEYIAALTYLAKFLSMNFLSHYDDQLPFWQLHINIVEVVAWVLGSIFEIKTTVLQVRRWLCNLHRRC